MHGRCDVPDVPPSRAVVSRMLYGDLIESFGNSLKRFRQWSGTCPYISIVKFTEDGVWTGAPNRVYPIRKLLKLPL